jgi:hypothetical protein
MALRVWVLTGCFVLIVGYLAYEVSEQDDRIEELERMLAVKENGRPQSKSPRGRKDSAASRERSERTSANGLTRNAPASPAWLVGAKRAVGSDSSSLEFGDDEVSTRLREIVREEQEAMEEERAQRRRDRWESRARNRLSEVGEPVGMSESTQGEILQLWSAEFTQMRSMFREGRTAGRDFEEIRGEIRQLFEDTDAQVKSMLNEEQYSAYQEARQSMRRRGRGGPPGPGGGGPGRGP